MRPLRTGLILVRFSRVPLDEEAFTPHEIELETFIQEHWTAAEIASLGQIEEPEWYKRLSAGEVGR
jgi:hypothetical protein